VTLRPSAGTDTAGSGTGRRYDRSDTARTHPRGRAETAGTSSWDPAERQTAFKAKNPANQTRWARTYRVLNMVRRPAKLTLTRPHPRRQTRPPYERARARTHTIEPRFPDGLWVGQCEVSSLQ
jgi:hypothetical protein